MNYNVDEMQEAEKPKEETATEGAASSSSAMPADSAAHTEGLPARETPKEPNMPIESLRISCYLPSPRMLKSTIPAGIPWTS